MTSWTPESRAAAVDELLGRAPVLPLVTIEQEADAIPLAEALLAAGLPVIEVALRTPVALAAIRAIRKALPEVCTGAGTVLSAADLEAASAAGALFAISPGATGELYQAAAGAAIPWLPAVATASEIMTGLAHGHRRFKFYPAEAAGGTAMLKAWQGPFREVRFCPTGGIGAGNAADYLALANVITVGGSWMLPAGAVAGRDWALIRRFAEHAFITDIVLATDKRR